MENLVFLMAELLRQGAVKRKHLCQDADPPPLPGLRALCPPPPVSPSICSPPKCMCIPHQYHR